MKNHDSFSIQLWPFYEHFYLNIHTIFILNYEGIIFVYYISREDFWFWLVKGHGLIVMFSSLLSAMLLSFTAYGLINQPIATAMG